jgi:hypothetical protein
VKNPLCGMPAMVSVRVNHRQSRARSSLKSRGESLKKFYEGDFDQWFSCTNSHLTPLNFGRTECRHCGEPLRPCVVQLFDIPDTWPDLRYQKEWRFSHWGQLTFKERFTAQQRADWFVTGVVVCGFFLMLLWHLVSKHFVIRIFWEN